MSGGVDSAVAALLAAQDGREALAGTLELWRDPENDAEAPCCSAAAGRRARALARGGAPRALPRPRERRGGLVLQRVCRPARPRARPRDGPAAPHARPAGGVP